jgi:hypothetical protein
MVLDSCVPAIEVWSYIGIASTLAVAIISVLYMLGKILSKSELEGLAKNELTQLFIALVIAISIVGLASISCKITKSIISDVFGVFGDGNQFTASTRYLSILIYKKGLPTIQQLWTSGFILEVLSSSELTLAKTKIKGSFLAPFSKIVNAFMFIVPIFLASLNAQLFIIQLSEAFAITLILPLGMILRTIPSLRKGGSFLMALAFGLYFVFPMTYVMDYLIYREIDPTFHGYAPDINLFETFEFSTNIITVLRYFNDLAVIIPQATVLALINFTITISFISIFTEFLDSIQ